MCFGAQEDSLLETHITCFFTPEEKLKGIDGLLFECKYCDCFLIRQVNSGFGSQKDHRLDTVLLSPTAHVCLRLRKAFKV